MAANKFATMLHRNTNKLAMILIYAVLEWILIVLLLLNSLFSYLIIKFADYFGLKPPCLWCSRVDHIFLPAGKNKNMHRDLLCEAHAKEISCLGFCSNHQKLVASENMCEDCSSSRPEILEASTKDVTFFGMIQTDHEEIVVENGHGSLNCSCCGDSIHRNMLPQIVIKPSWDISEYANKGKSITDTEEEEDHREEPNNFDGNRSDSAADRFEIELGSENNDGTVMVSEVNNDLETDWDGLASASVSVLEESRDNEVEKLDDEILEEKEKEEIVEEKQDKIVKNQDIQVSVSEDASIEILPQHLEFFIDCSGHRLVPVDLIDSATEEEDQSREIAKDEDQGRSDEQGSDFGTEIHEEANTEVTIEDWCREDDAQHPVNINEDSKFSGFESMEIQEDEHSLVFFAREFLEGEVAITPMTQTLSQDSGDLQEMEAAEVEEKHTDIHPEDAVCEDFAELPTNDTEPEVSIGTEIPDLDAMEDIQAHQSESLNVCFQEVPATSEAIVHDEFQGSTGVQEQKIDLNTLSDEVNAHVLKNRSSFCSDLNEIEEDKAPDTPTSVDSLHQLHKKLLLLEKKDSGTEESLDGSITSELECADGVVTTEQLKTALRTERKALHTLYAELEEERNASAIAANQTMAMINRLQEEKAAMQMEALQYQRMMEEQAEYDQEALQLLNELMVKREKEKEELEKELEIYRKKVLEYETKERLRILRKGKDGSGFSSPSCSHAEDSDAASIDLNQEAKDEDGFYSHRDNSDNEKTPVNGILNLEESIGDFEEERLSILEQLKALEEKLMTLDGEELQHFEDVRPIDYREENGHHIDENGHFDGLENGHSNGFPIGMKRSIGPKGKSLLPLFDAISDHENGDVLLNGHEEDGIDSNGFHKSISPLMFEENKRVAVEEELDHLYERLQALEADREFLKHCISSLNKGDKGMHLLHEILHHLKDLRNVDLRVKSLSDGTLV